MLKRVQGWETSRLSSAFYSVCYACGTPTIEDYFPPLLALQEFVNTHQYLGMNWLQCWKLQVHLDCGDISVWVFLQRFSDSGCKIGTETALLHLLHRGVCCKIKRLLKVRHVLWYHDSLYVQFFKFAHNFFRTLCFECIPYKQCLLSFREGQTFFDFGDMRINDII